MVPILHEGDFIRGYFDGNGCVCVRPDNWITIEFCSGSYRFCESLRKRLLHHGIETLDKNDRRKGHRYQFVIKGSSRKDFRNLIYYSPRVFCLEKKRKKIISHKTINDYLWAKDLAKMFGVSSQTITKWGRVFNLPYSYKTAKGQRYYSRPDVKMWDILLTNKGVNHASVFV